LNDCRIYMTIKELKKILESNPDSRMHWILPDKSFVPDHYHITEVGRVRKDFVDCGGTVRSAASCVLQVWVADDADHRLKTDKLSKIMASAEGILESEDLPVEVERVNLMRGRAERSRDIWTGLPIEICPED